MFAEVVKRFGGSKMATAACLQTEFMRFMAFLGHQNVVRYVIRCTSYVRGRRVRQAPLSVNKNKRQFISTNLQFTKGWYHLPPLRVLVMIELMLRCIHKNLGVISSVG